MERQPLMSTNDFTPRQLNADNFADRWQPRPDARSKARGEQRYPTDELAWPGLLHGRILRSPFPHAQITGINVDAARELPGVHAVVTAADIPGDNHYGIVFRDQPVFCTDRVRYLGDALAAVARQRLQRLADRLSARQLSVTYEAALAAHIATQCHTEGGARLIERWIERHIQTPIANQLLADAPSPRTLHLSVAEQGGLCCDFA